MGTYFNPSNAGFRQAVNSRIYIDKTQLIDILNSRLFTEEKCISVSHARRFGKSQAADMIDAYYSRGCDSGKLFSKLEGNRQWISDLVLFLGFAVSICFIVGSSYNPFLYFRF